MIQINHVEKRYGDLVAVDDVSLELGDEIFALLGRNGAGKSTLITMLVGIFPPDKGHIAVFGHDVRRESLAAKQEIGYLPENLNLYPRLTIDEFLLFLAGVRTWRAGEQVALSRTSGNFCNASDSGNASIFSFRSARWEC
jgi:ABC-2 type transport system ATP-binding protein